MTKLGPTRLCSRCRWIRYADQFVEGSNVCAECRRPKPATPAVEPRRAKPLRPIEERRLAMRSKWAQIAAKAAREQRS